MLKISSFYRTFGRAYAVRCRGVFFERFELFECRECARKQYAKPSMIQHTHINQLIALTRVFNEENIISLQAFWDQVETHFWGLKAMSVDKTTYSSIVVPVLMEKLPKQIRFNMVRFHGKSTLDWTIEMNKDGLRSKTAR